VAKVSRRDIAILIACGGMKSNWELGLNNARLAAAIAVE
jgi:pseudouridine-5'-phosphate glycosidase